MSDIDSRLDGIARHPFRAKFHLRGRERATAELRGIRTLRLHARDLIFKRLGPEGRTRTAGKLLTGAIRCSSHSMRPRPAVAPAWNAGTRSRKDANSAKTNKRTSST